MALEKSNTALVARELSLAYGNLLAVDRVSVSVQLQERLFLLGPNGAGKTSLIKLLCGLLTQDSGTVSLTGRNVSAMTIGYCPQHLSIWRDLTCSEQLVFMAKMHGVPACKRKKTIPFLLDNLNLRDKENHLAGHLSGGMQQALNLALSMVHDPDVLILDEPFAGIDLQRRFHLRNMIHALAHKKGKGILISTHDIGEAEKMADRVAIMDKGVMLKTGTPEALKGEASDSLEEVFMALTNRGACP